MRRRNNKVIDPNKEYVDIYGVPITINCKVVYAARTGGAIKRGYVISIDDKGIQCEWEGKKKLDICEVCTDEQKNHYDADWNQLLGHSFIPLYDGVEIVAKGRPLGGDRLVVVTGWENP